MTRYYVRRVHFITPRYSCTSRGLCCSNIICLSVNLCVCLSGRMIHSCLLPKRLNIIEKLSPLINFSFLFSRTKTHTKIITTIGSASTARALNTRRNRVLLCPVYSTNNAHGIIFSKLWDYLLTYTEEMGPLRLYRSMERNKILIYVSDGEMLRRIRRLALKIAIDRWL